MEVIVIISFIMLLCILSIMDHMLKDRYIGVTKEQYDIYIKVCEYESYLTGSAQYDNNLNNKERNAIYEMSQFIKEGKKKLPEILVWSINQRQSIRIGLDRLKIIEGRT